MSVYDIAMLVIFFGAIWFGFWKGLSWQVASLASIFLSYFVAVSFPNSIAPYISAEAPWNRFAAMLILFCGTSLVVWTVFGSISKSIKRLELKGFDRQAGALLGGFKGAVLCMVVTMFIVSLMGDRVRETIHNSKTGYYVVSGINQLSAFAPAGLNQYLAPYVQDFQLNILDENGVPPQQNPIFNPNNGQYVDDQYQGTGAFSNVGYPTNQPGSFQSQSQPRQAQFPSNGGFQGQPAQPQAQQPSVTDRLWQGASNAWGQATSGQPPAQAPAPSQWQPPAGQPRQPASGGWSDQFPSIQQGENGWPDVNFKVNSKELLQRGAGAAVDAGRQWIENNNR